MSTDDCKSDGSVFSIGRLQAVSLRIHCLAHPHSICVLDFGPHFWPAFVAVTPYAHFVFLFTLRPDPAGESLGAEHDTSSLDA